MRFARHLAAVLITVAAVVALGVAWAHSSEASWLADPNRGSGPVRIIHPGQLAKARQLKIALARRGGGGSGLSLSNSGELIKTGLIEAAVMTVVIVVSVVRRQRRRARRARCA